MNDDDSYQIWICLFICRFLALPQLTSCSTHVSERKTHKNPQSGREVCWVCMSVHFLLRPWTMSIGSGIPWRSWWLIPRSGLLRADDLWVLLEGSTRNGERPDVQSSDEVFWGQNLETFKNRHELNISDSKVAFYVALWLCYLATYFVLFCAAHSLPSL